MTEETKTVRKARRKDGYKGNTNSQTNGLQAKQPRERVILPWDADDAHMGRLATDLGDSLIALADDMRKARNEITQKKVTGPDLHQISVLMSAFGVTAAEAHRFGAELMGGAGVIPAKLGRLRHEEWDKLMVRLSQDARLVLSQCKQGYHWLMANGTLDDAARPRNATKLYLDRSKHALKVLRIMASCRAWHTSKQRVEDPAEMVIRAIEADRAAKDWGLNAEARRKPGK